ncbi:NAD(P)-binding protein [Pseudoalteromonas rhizosphaerae]|uniref:NAD(P)-binding protein n=1 Tax=Pseudoalteromonas rhizosphaerae TaxID=2518973 RepID=UPI0012317304|nr:NAD(P)-binding protein [Pseudoalteromonas rhizosphaerae]
MEQEKIVIIGGGVAAMTAALYLTEQPNWQQKRHITVYQQGWRLGGKGASGRNAVMGQRIEEHGLHVWFGAYVNSFKTIETVYDKLQRPPTSALSTWQQALKPHSFIALEEHIDDQWQTWPIEFPVLPGNPANGSLDITVWDFVKMTLAWLKEWIPQFELAARVQAKSTQLTTKKPRDRYLLRHFHKQIQTLVSDGSEAWQTFTNDIQNLNQEITSTPSLLVDKLNSFVQSNNTLQPQISEKKDSLVIWYIVRKLKRWINQELTELLDDNAELRRIYICADLAIAMLVGLIKDKVYRDGFGVINKYDFRQWLLKNGANKQYSVDSAPVRGFYDLVFAYPQGDFKKPSVEAGVAALAMLRIALCYRGGVMWKMQAGMGDVIFAPLYELLKQRGVNFEFFHQLQQLTPGIDESGQKCVASVLLQQQVSLNNSSEYQPLIDVKNLACWPSEPLYQQINHEQALLLKQNNINLESFWSDWPSCYQAHFGAQLPTKTLQFKDDFDRLILGVSVASLEHVCPQLLAIDDNFAAQAKNVLSVATQASQIWLNKTDQQLGWQYMPPSEEGPILSGFSEPFDTWAAMQNLIDKEQWPASNSPQNIAYFCSAFPCQEYPPQSDHGFPARAKAQVKTNLTQLLTTNMQPLWPLAYNDNDFDWSILYTQDDVPESARLDQQYWRVNVDPSERYVLSVSGSSQYRLATDGTQFSNLFITGDWIKTGVNAGCVEAAVMAGMQTARALCGYPQQISGENAFEAL